jgi:hypothetical protein
MNYIYMNEKYTHNFTIMVPLDLISSSAPDSLLLYICYTYSDIEVGLCFKALVTHLALGHVARARVILI